MRHEGLVLRVRNVEQKILWEEELSGQISDGMWENARPNNHWEDWTSATVVVDPDNPGRNWVPVRASYNFSSKDLLDVVGDRMLEYVRVGTGNTDYSMTDMRKDLRDLQQIIKQYIKSDTPVPAQPKARKVVRTIDGYPHEYPVYAGDVQDDPAAVKALAERERKQKEYGLKNLEKRLADARAEVAKLEGQVAERRSELGMLL